MSKPLDSYRAVQAAAGLIDRSDRAHQGFSPER